MKVGRSYAILRLLARAARSFLKNEPYTLDRSLEALDNLGGVYIKFLQMVVLQMDASQQKEFGPMLAVYEHSKPDRLDVHTYLQRHTPALYDSIKTLHIDPFATGSFGQLYRAELQDGSQVVIKILRPSVVRYLRADLRLLRLFTHIAGLFDKNKLFNFNTIYKEFYKTSIRETDYIREAHTAKSYYDTFKDHPYMVIPVTYTTVSNQTVLVQEYIEGVSVAKALERQNTQHDARLYIHGLLGSDLYFQLYTIGYELLTKAIVGHRFHADPHPGNILLLPNNKVALIDFGMTAILSEGKMAFYEMLIEYKKYYDGELEIENFMMASLKLLAPELFSAIRQADQILQNEHGHALFDHIKQLARSAAEAEDVQPMIQYFMERRMIMRVLYFAVNRQNRFGFTFDMKSAVTLKAVQTFIVMSLKFDPESVIMRQVITDAVATASTNLDQIADMGATQLRPHEAIDVLSRWFDRVARNDPWFVQKLAGKYMR